LENKPLVNLYGTAEAALQGQVIRLAAERMYGENIPKFFGGFYKPIGMEFEIEGIGDIIGQETELSNRLYWKVVKDGSLRNNGLEFVSKPVCGHGIDYALCELERILVGHSQRTSSVRTSIHVHVDVSNWDTHTLFLSCALYALFENPFFAFNDPIRKINPYCFPITNLWPQVLNTNEGMKYCAYNIAPVSRQLTVEFRQAEYSEDFKKNRRWIQLVCKFMKFVDENRNLRSIIEDTIIYDNYEKLFRRVLGKTADVFNMDVTPMMKQNAAWALAVLEII
jgi:hypothetical protein